MILEACQEGGHEWGFQSMQKLHNVSQDDKKTCQWSKTKKHPGSSHSTIFTIEDDFEAISEPPGRHPAAQAKRFRELCKIWSTKKCMPRISLLVEIIDSDAPNHGVFRVLDGAEKVPKRDVNLWSREQKKPNGLTYNRKTEKHVIIAAEVLKKWKMWVWP